MKRQQTPWDTLKQLSNQTGISHDLVWTQKKKPSKKQILQAIDQINNQVFLSSFNDIQQPTRQRNRTRQIRNPNIIEKRSYSMYGGDVIRKTYDWVNPQNIDKKKFLEITSIFPTNTSLRFPVQFNDGRIEFRTVKPKNLHKLANNNFTFNTREIGSDPDYSEDAHLDFSRPFIATQVKQKSQLSGSCNNQQETIKKLKHCVVIDPYTRNKNCGFACLKKLGFSHDVPLKNQGQLTPKQLLDICERNQLPVEIILDEVDSNNQLKSIGKTSSPINNHKQIVFALRKGIPHYYVFHDRYQSKEEKKEQNKQIQQQLKEQDKKQWVLVFYDLETVFDKDQEYLATTYSASYYSVMLSNFDKQITPENIEEFKSKCKFLTGQDVCQQMLNNLLKDYNTDRYRFKFISFNGSNFDDYFLLKQAMRNGENVHATFQSKSILGLTFQYGQCWDLRKFLTVGSLDSLCTSFNIYPKKIGGFNHREVQDEFEQGWLDLWLFINEKQLQEYNKFDVLSLYSLTQKFRNQIQYLTKTDVFDYQTIGSHSFQLCQSKWDDDLKSLLKAPITEEDDQFIRKCLTAGRCQVMGKPEEGKKYVHLTDKRLSMVDVVSLYPYVMINDQNYYPCGSYSHVQQRNIDKLGFYQIIVKQREDLPNVLPKRDFDRKDVPLDWNYKQEYTTYCTSVDLDVLQQYGNSYQIVRGIEFDQKVSGDVIFQSLLPFKQEKIKQDVYKQIYSPAGSHLYNQAMRETCKIYLNSLSGKVIQRNFDNVTKIIRSRRELHKFINECEEGSCSIHSSDQEFIIGNGKKQADKKYNPKSAKPSYLGVYIYAYARKHMYDNIYTQFDTQYTDTDSALGTYEQELLLRQNRPSLFEKKNMLIDGMQYQVQDFGSLDSELQPNANEAILVRSKTYFVGNRSENYIAKLKCKGVSFKNESCKYVPDCYKQSSISKNVFQSINITLKNNQITFFDQLMRTGKVKVACEQFIVKSLRSAKNDKFGVAIRHIIKEITVNND